MAVLGSYLLTILGTLGALLLAAYIARVSHFYSAVIFLIVVWLILLGANAYMTYLEGVHLVHGHEHHSGLRFANAALENLQSEVWQVWLATMVFKHLIHVGSPESKEPNKRYVTRFDRWISLR